MIPHNLQLKNFLSYGPETQIIDFKPYHLICLSGKNGHGKSALLDAITWAIWGQARKTSGNAKADQGLLHLGQNHMFVVIEFEVNEQIYRIRREYVQTKSKPFTSLDFGVMQNNQKFAALTDKTIKNTQLKIEKTIGITYESFISSAFLRQGQSNEFSKKSPKERKEVLGQILQLQRFDEQKKIALIQAKNLNLEYKTLSSIQQRIESELEQLLNISDLQKETIQKIKNLEKIKQQLENDKQLLSIEQKTTDQKLQEYTHIQKQIIQIKKLLEETKEQINIIAQQWHTTNNTLHKNNDHKQLEHEEKTLSKELKILQEKLQKKLFYREEYLKIKEERSTALAILEKKSSAELQTLQIELSKLQEQYNLQKRHCAQIAEQIKKISIEIKEQNQDLQNTNTTLKQHELVIRQYKEQETHLEKLKSQYQHICTQGILLKEEATKLNSLHNNTKQACPLCTQTLSQQGLHAIKQQENLLQVSLQTLKQKAQEIKSILMIAQSTLQKTKNEHEASINLNSKKLEQEKSLQKAQQQLADLEAESDIKQKEKQSLLQKINLAESAIQKTINIHKDMSSNANIKVFDQKLKKIENDVKDLDYNQTIHKETEEKLTKIQTILTSIQNTTEILTKQAEKKAELFALFKTIQKNEPLLIELNNNLQGYSLIEKNKQLLEQRDANIADQLKKIQKEQTDLFIEKGSLEQKQKKQQELQQELIKINTNISSIKQELFDYQEIAKALGKDGIQALLIEQAIPEIENEANEVLARLTNNQTQIFIESLRDLKKGGNRETLDIKISDSFGLRDYELFSGGEAFRIDFALRIGISKLLARKAGTTLQTIFIDEGFGSQDEEGLQLIMDNIYKIQDEFAKVIVVSHLPEMKENFPVQFIVEKKRSGSTISIIEQG